MSTDSAARSWKVAGAACENKLGLDRRQKAHTSGESGTQHDYSGALGTVTSRASDTRASERGFRLFYFCGAFTEGACPTGQVVVPRDQSRHPART